MRCIRQRPSDGPPHSHYFQASSTEARGHYHQLYVFTYPSNGTAADQHIHRFQGITSVQDLHFHRFEGYTGPPKRLNDGTHIHFVQGCLNSEPFEYKGGYYKTLTRIPRHTHCFEGYTSVPIGFEPPGW